MAKRGKISAILMGTVLLSFMALPFVLSCGDPEKPPFGVEVIMPDDIDYESAGDMYWYIPALVLDADGMPMNGIEVRFLCSADEEEGYALFVELNRQGEYLRTLNSPYYINTDELGVAEIHVWVNGSFEGEFQVSATVGDGLAGDDVMISKTVPTE